MQRIKKIQKDLTDKHIDIISTSKYGWIDISQFSRKHISLLESLGVANQDILDALPPLQWPKIVVRKNYIFMTLLFPHQTSHGDVKAAEIDFFIFKDMLITCHFAELNTIKKIKQSWSHNIQDKKLATSEFPFIFEHLLIALYEYSLSMANHLGNEIDSLERTLTSAQLSNKSITQEIYRLARKSADLRQIVRNHEPLIQRVLGLLIARNDQKIPEEYYYQLSSYPQTLWAHLEAHQETIYALRQSYESLTAFELNQIIKTLTVISFVIAPMTLIASILGMNFLNIPYKNHPLGFIGSIILMVVLGIVLFLYLRRKRWI